MKLAVQASPAPRSAGRTLGCGLRRGLLLLAALLPASPGWAHEFWMLPQAFDLAAGEVATLSLAVGQDFAGEPVAFSRPLVAGLRHLARDADVDLRPLMPATGAAPILRVRLARTGTHVIALDSNPSAIELPAAKFNDYLRLEGLVSVLQARERAGTADTPGREHYRRNVKTLLQAGGSDDTFRRRTGQRLELVPLADPARLAPAQSLPLQLWFDDRPLAGALVKLWHGPAPQLLALAQVTDAQGRVSFVLPRPGTWMASVVHMIPAPGARDHDWDSYWGNLTFAVPPGAGVQAVDASAAPRR